MRLSPRGPFALVCLLGGLGWLAPGSAFGARRALVVGNWTYQHAKHLTNPEYDVDLVGDALEGIRQGDVELRHPARPRR